MLRALLIDDDRLIRKIISDAFSDFGIEVKALPDPTCLSCIQDKSEKCPFDKACVDFILTDNQMPHMTGLYFLKQLEHMRCKIPLQNRAIISGNFSPSDFEEIKQLGVRSFNKPCPFDKIYEWLGEIKSSTGGERGSYKK